MVVVVVLLTTVSPLDCGGNKSRLYRRVPSSI